MTKPHFRSESGNRVSKTSWTHFAILSLGIASLPLTGQTPPAVGSVPGNMQIPTPGLGHDYIHLLSETVDPASGNLTLRIQLPVAPGRGISPPVVIAYNSGEVDSLVEPSGQLEWATQLTAPVATGWGLPTSQPLNGTGTEWNFTSTGQPTQISCNYLSGIQLVDISGTAHTIGWGGMAPGDGAGTCSTSLASSNDWDQQMQGALGPNAAQQLGDGDGVTVNAEDINGNTYAFTTQGMGGSGGANAATMEDRNGNILSSSTDTAGRSLPYLQIPAVTGTYNVFGLAYKITTTQMTVTYDPAETAKIFEDYATNCDVTGVFGENKATITVISSIELPNNEVYTFGYDPVYGVMNQITYPDGGWVQYTWGLSSGPQAAASFPAVNSSGATLTNACTFEYQTPVITARKVSFDGTNTAQTQTFTYSTSWNSSDEWTTKSTNVWTADNAGSGHQYLTVYNYSPAASGVGSPYSTGTFDAEVPLESSILHYDWGNPHPTTPLDTVTKSWINPFQEACEVHTLINGRSSGTFYSWNYGFVSDERQFDYQTGSALATACSSGSAPSGTPARETKINFYQFSTPLPPNLTFAKPCAVMTYGNGTEVAETDYGYDEESVAPVPTLTSHDETYFSSLFPGAAQSYSPSKCTPAGGTPQSGRGNMTTASQRCLGGGCSANSVTTYQYDETGQVISVTDPCGNGSCADMPSGGASSHTTQYSYADNYEPGFGTPPAQTNAYLVSITNPSENGVTLEQSFQYRYSDGQLSQQTDLAGNATNYIYGGTQSECGSTTDYLNRLTVIQHPDGGRTQYCYNDGIYNGSGKPNVTTYELLFGSTWKQTVASRDGLGHVLQTVVVEPAPTNNDTQETTYDGEGRVYTSTNPHRSNTLSTDGTTHFYYNGAGQLIAQKQPDSAWLNWCYNDVPSILPTGATNVCSAQGGNAGNLGTWIDSTDESGRHWRRVSDSFGRLTEVLEPDTSNNATLETDYAYDGLDDLIEVDQWGGAYGSTGDRQRNFTYDSFSQLITASNPETGSNGYSYDVNGNLISKTDARSESIWYCYDFLDRTTSRAYSQQGCPMNSPVESYTYDVPFSSWNQGAEQTYVKGRLAGKFTASTGSIFGYDKMGRVVFQSSCTPSTCGTGQFKFTAAYDTGGDLTQLIYPDTRNVTWTWDAAEHLIGVAFNKWNGQSIGYSYLSAAAYWPDASPMTTTLGNGLATTWNRNKRLQPLEITITNSANTTLLDRQYCYGTASVSGANCSTPSQADNGNILQIVDRVNSTNTQTMTYDNLNRISSFTNAATPPTMQQTYFIDPWGNVVMYGTQINGLAFAGTNNRDTSGSIGYDADGNSTSIYNGLTTNTFVFDAESRISSINSDATSYTYDADSQRVAKTTGSAWTEYLYFGGIPLAENNSDTVNGEWTDYIYANGARIAEGYTSSPTSPSTTTNFYSSDQINSATMLRDGSDGPVESYLYYPFGVGAAADANNHYLFTGKERDTESGNDYFEARYYGSSMGRFMSPDYSDMTFGPDPVPNADITNPQSLNLYAYGQNNPVKNIDPDGHDCINTSNYSTNGTVTITTGSSCASDPDKYGTYVDGTINQNSITANTQASGTTFGYNFTSYDGQSGGAGVLTQAPAYGPLEGPANLAGAAMIGSGTKAIGAFAGASIVGGVLGAGGLAVAGTDLTLSSISAAMRFRAAQAAWLALKGTGAAALIGQFFKTGEIPPGLTPEIMQTYLTMAQAYVNSGIMPPGGVATQTARIAQLAAALGK